MLGVRQRCANRRRDCRISQTNASKESSAPIQTDPVNQNTADQVITTYLKFCNTAAETACNPPLNTKAGGRDFHKHKRSFYGITGCLTYTSQDGSTLSINSEEGTHQGDVWSPALCTIHKFFFLHFMFLVCMHVRFWYTPICMCALAVMLCLSASQSNWCKPMYMHARSTDIRALARMIDASWYIRVHKYGCLS